MLPLRSIGIPFGLAGMGIGMGIIGEQFGSAGLISGGEVAAGFVSPAVNIIGAGMVLGLLRGFPKKL